ncbi:hypothetical protein KKG24_01130 [Patescibacteria group bacterium]|nr:hypothetical protein [Patescibacteria group bacterium]
MEKILSKRIIKIGGFTIFFILIILYAILGSKDLIFGVKIKNVNLTDGITVIDNIIKLTGNAKNAINLTLNGREISVDQDGNFNETVALFSGYNVINIKAKDKFGYVDEKNYKIMYVK